jgi:archaellum component FlaF (FlaF/FlaG flagellin family)
MKKTTFLKTATLLTTFLLSAGSLSVFAVDQSVVGNSGTTNTTVTITDNDTPVDPTDPDQNQLVLKKVPTAYDFTTAISDIDYSITSGDITDGTIDVLNDRISREWNVKAKVVNDTLTASGKTVNVTAFKINGTTLATGSETIVAANGDLTAAANTGLISTPVTSVAIDFTDSSNTLKVGDVLTGQISYQLYLVGEPN